MLSGVTSLRGQHLAPLLQNGGRFIETSPGSTSTGWTHRVYQKFMNDAESSRKRGELWPEMNLQRRKTTSLPKTWR